MNMTIPIEVEHLNCKAVADLINNFDCKFLYNTSGSLGIVIFENKTDVYMFTERLDEIMANIETLNNLYEMED